METLNKEEVKVALATIACRFLKADNSTLENAGEFGEAYTSVLTEAFGKPFADSVAKESLQIALRDAMSKLFDDEAAA